MTKTGVVHSKVGFFITNLLNSIIMNRNEISALQAARAVNFATTVMPKVSKAIAEDEMYCIFIETEGEVETCYSGQKDDILNVLSAAINFAVKNSSIEEIEKHIQKMIAFKKQNQKINQQ
jgi:hypothetical protein